MAKLHHKTVQMEQVPGKTRERLISDATISPYYTNANTIVDYAGSMLGEISLMEACKSLQEQVADVHKGSLKEAEKILMVQAITLNTMFAELARRAALNMGEHMEATDKYLKLALKAQGQCRTTLETLANIKNPPVVFAKQANIAHNQQVNQTVAGGNLETTTRTHAGKTENAPNELSEGSHELLENAGASSLTGAINPALETVGTVNRPAHR